MLNGYGIPCLFCPFCLIRENWGTNLGASVFRTPFGLKLIRSKVIVAFDFQISSQRFLFGFLGWTSFVICVMVGGASEATSSNFAGLWDRNYFISCLQPVQGRIKAG